MTHLESRTKSRFKSALWDSIHRHGWRDEDDFTLRFADAIFRGDAEVLFDRVGLAHALVGVRTSFFTVNKLAKTRFVETLLKDLGPYIHEFRADGPRPMTLTDLFPEAAGAGPLPSEIRQVLDVPERALQDGLRRILSSKGAFPIPARQRDTAQEVADIEWFRMKVRGELRSFAVVVKGFRSISGKKLTWEDVAHQVTKAYRATPDHIMVIAAKDPVDGLLTHLQEYGKSVGNPELPVFIGPGDLWRVFRAHGLM